MDTYFRSLFDAIINKRVIEIVYYPFVIDPCTITIHSHHLKQYNDRRFICKQTD